ncbi:putative DUF21 domain-containing protein At1g03270 isoform X2 [Euphorbia lathyris]|uniref:putative DUF21 domain-containing protein At1g03270 isoform X2 n=1 Tax=Euphorbia lathyris TaxID=212925 RepID=UPI0033132D40
MPVLLSISPGLPSSVSAALELRGTRTSSSTYLLAASTMSKSLTSGFQFPFRPHWEAIGKILARGHSRVPVYSGSPKNIIGLLLVKSLLTVRAESDTPISAVSIQRIPRVPSDMPLYDILNEFQKGSSWQL